MMEHKSWLWKKKSTEKTMITPDKINRGNEDEANLADKVELEKNLKISDEKLSAALAEIDTKDEIAQKQTNIAREAIQGWEKAETEVLVLKQELEKLIQQRVADEERTNSADAALKECMLQLRFVREEQEKRIHDAVVKTANEHEKRIMVLEEKLAESNKKISKLGLENTQLITTLSSKEKMINELHSVRAQLDYDLSNVVSKLESTQRENASLIYEVRVLEKELEIRNEERDFNRRTSEVAHKQYIASVKKIAKLETEAQRLRVLVQKRLPGPADVAKMKTAVDILVKEPVEVSRRKSNPFPVVSHDFIVDNASSKKIAFLTEQMCAFEEENKLLKEFLTQKTSELSKSQTSDMGSDEKVSMAGSWAPSCNTVGASDIDLMDDFVEMEKLALVFVEKKDGNGYSSIQRLIEIIEGIRLCDKDDNLLLYKNSETPAGYTVHIFQWKTSELRSILEAFLKVCNKLVNGKVGVEDFAKELTLSLEWIVNHCFSLQDVSSMKDEIKKRFEWDETRSESGVEGGTTGHLSEVDKFNFLTDQSPGWPMANIRKNKLQVEEVQPNATGEVTKLKDDLTNLESADKDLEVKLQSESDKCAALVIQPQESEKAIGTQQTEVDIMVKDVDKHPIKIVDELNETHQESMTEIDMKSCDLDQDEITTASEKLAECQETIFSLGKQLKEMTSSPTDTTSSDTCEITVLPLPNEINNERISLLDKMIIEDPSGAPRSQKTKVVARTLTSPAILDGNSNPVAVMSPRMFVSVDGVRDEKDEEALVNFLSIVSNKKKSNGGGILKRLFWKRKKVY